MTSRESSIRERYEKAGQGQVFQHWENLPSEDRECLLDQLDSIVIESLDDLLKAAQASSGVEGPIEPFAGTVGLSCDSTLVASSRSRGLEAIRNGQVAALVLAGGQGTRLGFDGPKGMYNMGLPSQKTLFQLMAERVVKLKDLSGCSRHVPFYIMTSPLNHDATTKFFEEKDFFGLGADNVVFFQQGMLPCLTFEGKIILEGPSKVAMAPDGNGGIYPSLQKSGALEDMEKRGIRFIHVFSIDNALVKPADPVFVGYCIEKGADCGNKSVGKAHAHEKVGVVGLRNGRPCIVEYSEITKEMAEQVDDQGRLKFGAGNICNHFYTVDFLKEKILPKMGNLYHIAKKKIPYYDETSLSTVKPDSNNGMKLETFIFDVFPLSESFAVLEVQRSEEFAPVKNAPGSPSDSPDTARGLVSKLALDWLSAAGAQLQNTDSTEISEISPLTSYAGEGLEKHKDSSMVCPVQI